MLPFDVMCNEFWWDRLVQNVFVGVKGKSLIIDSKFTKVHIEEYSHVVATQDQERIIYELKIL